MTFSRWTVLAGEYGRQVLQSFGVWKAIEPKLVLAKDVRQVLTYIESGNADAGIVYASDSQASRKVRVVAVAPSGSHEPAVYPVAAVHLISAEERLAVAMARQ